MFNLSTSSSVTIDQGEFRDTHRHSDRWAGTRTQKKGSHTTINHINTDPYLHVTVYSHVCAYAFERICLRLSPSRHLFITEAAVRIRNSINSQSAPADRRIIVAHSSRCFVWRSLCALACNHICKNPSNIITYSTQTYYIMWVWVGACECIHSHVVCTLSYRMHDIKSLAAEKKNTPFCECVYVRA